MTISHSPLLNKPALDLIPKNCGRVLDIACGRGEWGFLLKTNKICSYLVGIDVWEPYLKKLREVKVYDELILWRLPNLPRFNQRFDMVIAMEILEHLSKKDGHELLNNIERLTKKRGLIVLSTPQNIVQDAIEGNPFQRHISQWTSKELNNLGYTVKTMFNLPRSLIPFDKIRRFIFRSVTTPLFLLATKAKR